MSLDPAVQPLLQRALRWAVVGSPQTVREGLKTFIAHTDADELMVTAQIFDHGARLRSFEILAEAHKGWRRRRRIRAG